MLSLFRALNLAILSSRRLFMALYSSLPSALIMFSAKMCIFLDFNRRDYFGAVAFGVT